MSDLDTLCETLGIKLDALLVGYMPDTDTPADKRWPHFAWRVTLTLGDRSHATDYKTGVGHVNPMPSRFMPNEAQPTREKWWRINHKGPKRPSAADIISALMSDASSGADTFEDFCSNLGYDTDSRRAMDTYLACQAASTAMRRLLGQHYTAVSEAAQEH
jgi:hypothetical protein